MKNAEGMSFEELVSELKRLRSQMKYFREVQGESNRLDAEWFHICKLENKGRLPEISLEKIYASRRNSGKEE